MALNPKTKAAIIILSVLLAASLLSLAGVLLSRHFSYSQPVSVEVPDNIITPEKDSTSERPEESSPPLASETAQSGERPETAGTQSQTAPLAPVLALQKNQQDVNQPFQAVNLFPGDRETSYYCVTVSYQNFVTVHYRADIRQGYDKLAEVLKCRIVLLSTGQTLYDGLMRDMPQSVSHSLSSDGSATDELYYQVTAYLDTSVDHQYMQKELTADFHWWAEPAENLGTFPQTGDPFQPILCLGVALLSLFLILLILSKRRKEAAHENQQ